MKFSGWARSAALLLGAGWILAGCDRAEDVTGPGNGGDVVTLAQIQSEIFDQNCVGCHRGGGAGELNLESVDISYEELVNVPAFHPEASGILRVVPNDPDASFLLMKLEGGEGLAGAPMPFGAPRLPDAQIQLVRDWIDAGAPRE